MAKKRRAGSHGKFNNVDPRGKERFGDFFGLIDMVKSNDRDETAGPDSLGNVQ